MIGTASSADRVRKFEATFKTISEAKLFLGHFNGSFGYLDGKECSVSETGIGNSTGAGPIVAVVSISPWQHAIADSNRTDFVKLLVDADAREVLS
jgi:hypothetical protein